MYTDYGPHWAETKRRWRAAWWTRKRCFWCRRSGPTDAHHLLYPRNRPAGDVSIFWLRPMCRRCHKVETWLAREHRKHMPNRRKRYAHIVATYGGRWCINVVVVLPLVILWMHR
jgi:hypothetical protein